MDFRSLKRKEGTDGRVGRAEGRKVTGKGLEGRTGGGLDGRKGGKPYGRTAHAL